MRIVFLPSCANVTARFRAVVVFPSPGIADVMTTLFSPPARERRRSVRNAR